MSNDQPAIIPETLIPYLLDTYAGGVSAFKPGRDFYNKVGCGQRRWGQLARGETSPTLAELRNICSHFNITFTPETFFRQLTLFPEVEIQAKLPTQA